MAQTKSARPKVGAHKDADPPKRQRVQRPSGAQHRKKALIRERTHRLVDAVLNFANYGKWPNGDTEWLTVYAPTPEENETYNPMLAALHQYAVAHLGSFSAREESLTTAVQTRLDVLAERLDIADVTEAARPESSDEIVQKLRAAWALCDAMWMHLRKRGGSTLVYRCITCGKWFVAWKHDPRDQGRPYCGKGCWPTDNPKDIVAPPRRVQSLKTKTPPPGV